MRRRRAVASATAVVVAAIALPVEATPRIALAYEAAPGCPDQARFEREVATRLHGTPAAAAAPPAEFRVRIGKRGDELQGTVTGARLSEGRTVRGPTCDGVARALALIIAVELDSAGAATPTSGGSGTARSASPDASSESAEAVPPTATSAPDAPDAESRAPAPEAPPSSAAATPEDVAPVATSPRRAASAIAVSLGAVGTAAVGPTPGVAWGGGVTGELRREGSLDQSLRLTLSYATTGEVAVGSGAAVFWLSTARLDACLLASTRPALTFGACLGAEAGALDARGLARGDVQQGHEILRPWVDVGAALRAALRIAGGARLELSAGAAIPLTRRSYVFDNPTENAYQAPWVVGRFLVGVSWDFPCAGCRRDQTRLRRESRTGRSAWPALD